MVVDVLATYALAIDCVQVVLCLLCEDLWVGDTRLRGLLFFILLTDTAAVMDGDYGLRASTHSPNLDEAQ